MHIRTIVQEMRPNHLLAEDDKIPKGGGDLTLSKLFSVSSVQLCCLCIICTNLVVCGGGGGFAFHFFGGGF